MHDNRTLRFVIIVFFPVLAGHACLAPFWFTFAWTAEMQVWLPDAQLALSALVVPVWLAFHGCRLVLRRVPIKLWIGVGLLASALAINVFLDYALWGVSSGRFWTPDGETVLIVELIAIVGAGITAIPALIILAVRYGGPGERHF